MSDKLYSSVAAIRTRMVVLSLIASAAVGGVAVAVGSSITVLPVVIVAALFCSLLSVGASLRSVGRTGAPGS
jgi:hypothetical protein